MAEAKRETNGTTTLPLFPLQTVLLPGVHLPLHIFEPRYRQLMADLVAGNVPGREFGVIAMRTPLVREVTSEEHLYDIGCSTVLREAKQLPDGRFDVVTTARRRFRLLEIDSTSAPYLLGSIEWLPDDRLPMSGVEAYEKLVTIARTAHRRYCESAWHSDDWRVPEPDAALTELAYQLAADCLLPLEDRQLLLEETHPVRRLRMVCRLLTREAGFLSTLGAVPMPTSDLGDYTRPSNLN